MNNIEKVREELLNNAYDGFGRGLFMLIDCLVDAGEDQICTSYGNLGITIQDGEIEFVDIESGLSLLKLTMNN